MGSPTVDIATGITINFGTSGFSAEILDLDGPNMTRESIESSHQLTENSHTFIPADLVDRGELSFGIHFNPDTDPPIDGPAETVTINWPTSGASFAFTGFMMEYTPTAPLNGKMTGNVTIKVSGDVTITGA